MSTINIQQLKKSYQNTQVIHGVDIDINDGEFVVLVGPSGCGKSTLLRAIAGLESVSDGKIEIDGKDVTTLEPADRDLSMVFQSYALYPHMSVRANMEFGMKVNGLPPAERKTRIEEAARVLQLSELLDRKPGQLSGGQRQRVAIGRSIVKNPKVFLFDEPLSNLDAKLRVQMRIELEALHKQLDATMIYVTHDQVEAMTMADRIVVLNEGRIEQVGSPMELYHTPASEFVAGFIGSPAMNILPIAQDIGDVTDAPAGAVKIGIRPEHIHLGEAGVPGTIRVKENLGSESYIYVMTRDDTQIVVKTDGEDTLNPGDSVHMTFRQNRLHHFDSKGQSLT